MMTICEIKDGNDYIIEGYHLEPRFIQSLMKKYGKKNLKAVFLTKMDAEKFAQDVHKSITPNDWLILGTKKKKILYESARWFFGTVTCLRRKQKNMDSLYYAWIKSSPNNCKKVSLGLRDDLIYPTHLPQKRFPPPPNKKTLAGLFVSLLYRDFCILRNREREHCLARFDVAVFSFYFALDLEIIVFLRKPNRSVRLPSKILYGQLPLRR